MSNTDTQPTEEQTQAPLVYEAIAYASATIRETWEITVQPGTDIPEDLQEFAYEALAGSIEGVETDCVDESVEDEHDRDVTRVELIGPLVEESPQETRARRVQLLREELQADTALLADVQAMIADLSV